MLHDAGHLKKLVSALNFSTRFAFVSYPMAGKILRYSVPHTADLYFFTSHLRSIFMAKLPLTMSIASFSNK